MKKLIAVLLVVATCMLALAGCGGSGSAAKAEQNVTLKLGFQANSSSNEYKAAELMVCGSLNWRSSAILSLSMISIT